MRAKRSKKYRKIMASYTQAFSFRPPYQVLLDAAFIRTCHAFKMPLQRSLENTLQEACKLFVTKCTLAKILSMGDGDGRKRPEWLPPPTELPLRHCKHNDAGDVVEEWKCLVDLCAGQPKGNEEAKNKQHFVLATAEATEEERRKAGRAFVDVRDRVRQVPGVPVVYVKRSVMVLEELSGASEGFRRGVEREKLRVGTGVTGNRKRKRGEEEDDDDDEEENDGGEDDDDDRQGGPKRRGLTKAKGPNPLSVRKKKPKPSTTGEQEQTQVVQQDTAADVDEAPAPRAKRRRKRAAKADTDAVELVYGQDIESTAIDNILNAHSRLQEVLG